MGRAPPGRRPRVRARLWQISEGLRASYWLVPTVMALAATVLAGVATTLDTRVGPRWMGMLHWVYASQPRGARSILATIAGSTITVAGVTFSITIAAVSFTAQQYGPRLLANFMRDRGSQVTLGTFTATYLYCLLVLRTVRAAGEETGVEAFVPHVGVFGALLLAILNVGVLIYFMHHVPESLHIGRVVADIGARLRATLTGLTVAPGEIPEDGGEAPGAASTAAAVAAGTDGYVHSIDEEALRDMCVELDLVIEVLAPPGTFVAAGQALLLAWPAARVGDEAAGELRSAFAHGWQRTPLQDHLFFADELVEIAARALSPGVNDPFTAMSCVDWLRGALAAFAERPARATVRRDADGGCRVWVRPLTPQRLADSFLDKLRPYFSRDRNAALHLMNALALLVIQIDDDGLRRQLAAHAAALREACDAALADGRDRALLAARAEVVRALAEDAGARAGAAHLHPCLFGV
jgi:uncharacterized membrane protein